MQRETLRVEEVCELLECGRKFARVHATQIGGRVIGGKAIFPVRPFCEATGYPEDVIRERIRQADDKSADIRARAARHMAKVAEAAEAAEG